MRGFFVFVLYLYRLDAFNRVAKVSLILLAFFVLYIKLNLIVKRIEELREQFYTISPR